MNPTPARVSFATQERIRVALMKIAADTGESLPSVIADAMIASVAVLVATNPPRRVDALYREAVKIGQWTKTEMQHSTWTT